MVVLYQMFVEETCVSVISMEQGGGVIDVLMS